MRLIRELRNAQNAILRALSLNPNDISLSDRKELQFMSLKLPYIIKRCEEGYFDGIRDRFNSECG